MLTRGLPKGTQEIRQRELLQKVGRKCAVSQAAQSREKKLAKLR